MTSAAEPTPPINGSSQEQPPPPGAAPRPQLRRSTTDKMAGGVCGGLADYTGIDAVLWRVGFVGLTVAGGAGILVYLLLWVLMPPAPHGPDDAQSPLDSLVERLHETLSGARGRQHG